jgi:hypothetical protein
VQRCRTVDLGEVDSADVMFAGDTHFGDSLADPRYQRFIESWVHAEPDRWLVLTGDLLNCAIVGSKSFDYSAGPVGDAMQQARVWLSSIGDRLIAQVHGNHDNRVARSVGIDVVRESTPDGMPYDGAEAFVTLNVGQDVHSSRNRSRRPVSYSLYVTHGVGGGRTDGAKLNNVTRLREIVVADMYVQGHQHDQLIKPKTVYEWSNDHRSIIERQQYCIVTPGGLMRTDHGLQGYACDLAYPPTSCELPVVTLDGRHRRMRARLVPVE